MGGNSGIVSCCCGCCPSEESEAVEGTRLDRGESDKRQLGVEGTRLDRGKSDKRQLGVGHAGESGVVEKPQVDKLPQGVGKRKGREEDDETRRARLAKRNALWRAYYHQRKHDPEWVAARAKIKAKTPSRLRSFRSMMDTQEASRLQQLFETVLEEEPWDAARHGKHTGKAWVRCGERVPGYLDTCKHGRPGTFVQQKVVCMVRQLRSPKSKTPRRWTPELRRRVEELAAKLEADPHHRDKVHPPDPANPRPPGENSRKLGGRTEEPRLSQQQQEQQQELERERERELGEAGPSQQQQGQQQQGREHGELSGKACGV